MSTQGSVYLIHFDQPFKHCKHYLGFCEGEAEETEKRLKRHRDGFGAKLLNAVNNAGINYQIVHIWHNKDRNFERQLKNWKDGPHFCPICNPQLKIKTGETLLYQGYSIEMETDPWALKYNMLIRYFKDEYIHHSTTVQDAMLVIDDISLPRHKIENGIVTVSGIIPIK